MFNAFNVDAIRGIFANLVGKGINMFFDSFETAVDHAYNLLMDSGKWLRGNVTPKRIIYKFFDKRTLKFWTKHMSICFDVDIKKIDDVTVYFYITVIVARSTFFSAKNLTTQTVVPDGTTFGNIFTTNAVVNDEQFEKLTKEWIKLHLGLKLVTDENNSAQLITVLPICYWQFSKDFLLSLLNSIYLGQEVKVSIIDVYNLAGQERFKEHLVRETRNITLSGYWVYAELAVFIGACEMVDPEPENFVPYPRLEENTIQYILRTHFIEHINDDDFKEKWYSVNTENHLICKTARLIEFYLFCDAIEAEQPATHLSKQAISLLSEDSIAKDIVLSKLVGLQDNQCNTKQVADLLNQAGDWKENFIDAAKNMYDSITNYVEMGTVAVITVINKARANPEIYQSIYTLYLYRNEEEQKTIAEAAERQQNINLCHGLCSGRGKVYSRNHYSKQRRPRVGTKSGYRGRTRDNIKIEISVDSDDSSEQQESSTSSVTSASDPFYGEKNIEKCYNRYTAYNSVQQLLRDDKFYQNVCQDYQQISEQLPKTFDTDAREKLRETLCEVSFKKYIQELMAISNETHSQWSNSDIVDVARRFVKGDNTKICGAKIIVEHEKLINSLTYNLSDSQVTLTKISERNLSTQW